MKLILTLTEALADPAAFAALPDYSASIPTGKTIGKRWKRRRVYHDESAGWLLGEYERDPDPDFVRIRWRSLEVVS